MLSYDIGPRLAQLIIDCHAQYICNDHSGRCIDIIGYYYRPIVQSGQDWI